MLSFTQVFTADAEHSRAKVAHLLSYSTTPANLLPINQMDPQAASSVEPRERAVSSEPCSTRANPFDDSDIPSRKRRRTSLRGASRSRSIDSSASSQSEQRTSTDDASLGTDSATMKDDTEPASPQTPEYKLTASQGTPRSSRVTINVRTPSRPLETIPSSPPVSEKELENGQASATLLNDDVKISVEETEVDMTRADTPEQNRASSGSETNSPPVEVITIDEDDGAEYGSGQPQFTLLHGVQDPTNAFPFHAAAESLADTVSRLTGFMTSRMSACPHLQGCRPLIPSPSCLDDAVARSVSEWIQSYLNFAKGSDYYAVLDSCRQHRGFWYTLPELVHCVITRRYVLADANA